MRRHAKASTAGSTQHKAIVALAILVALGAALISAVPAFAATITDRPQLFSFDGSDTTAGHLVRPGKIAIDNATGTVYVAEGDSSSLPLKNVISKFNPDGTAASFSATGASSLFASPAFGQNVGVAVDNSGGPNQGRLYVVTRNLGASTANRLMAFSPAGELLWQFDPGGPALDVAVDSAGHPWAIVQTAAGRRIKGYASSGNPPAQIASLPFSGVGLGGGRFAIDIDAAGNFYITTTSGVQKFDAGGNFVSTLDPEPMADVYVDQSSATGHIYTTEAFGTASTFNEYDASGALLNSANGGIGELDLAGGIAYNHALNRLYVADNGPSVIAAFGAPITGTVPDATIEATTGVGVATATFNGTVNPQGVANGYYFEWTKSCCDFTVSSRSPLQSLPVDSSPHPASFESNSLFGNSNYKVRLVTVNTENGLRKIAAGVTTFKTAKAAAAPVVTIDPPSALTTTAHLSGTVNPKEDSTTWGTSLSTDPDCAAGYTAENVDVIPGGGVNSPVAVETDLKNLLPAQHYCVRITASNSAGQTSSETREFSTEAISPSEASTAFAAPRTDTTARIDARVNPEGQADFTYRFELSEDGVSWTLLPERESTIDARNQIVVADELTELEPNTTYYYRLAGVENEGGSAAAGATKTFTTRTTAEMNPPQRGIELVNNPDKGNQNVFVPVDLPAITADGEKALWTVPGGAPGGPNGTLSTFLAERTANGWRSRSLAPPAIQQVGGGSLYYAPEASTPDFSRFSFLAERKVLLGVQSAATRVRLDAEQHQEVLQSYEWNEEEHKPGGVDMTDDGSHLLTVNGASGQLEELGATPEVVSLMPDGTPSSCGLNTWAGASFVGGSRGGGYEGAAAGWRSGYHMVDTADASLVYFEAKPNGECAKPWGLYVRDRETEETTLIDPGASGQDVVFIRATPDGSSGYFATFSQLDPADTNEDGDVYRWDQESGESSCLTCVVADAGVEITGGIMVSDDFSHVYFQSRRRLVADGSIAGMENIYVLHGGAVRLVAHTGGLIPLFPNAGAQLSADGDVLLFREQGEPGVTADEVAQCSNTGFCLELYRYDDRDASLECLSCRHDGVTTHGLEGSGNVALLSEFPLSADGSTTIFGTAERLTPQDVNGGLDIYEWRNGARRLVTDGVTEFPTSLSGPIVRAVDADGSNLFFTVTDPGLTGFEEDGLANLYDARIGGGFEPPSRPVHCSEDSCQGPLQAPPVPGPSASSTFSGAGNEKSGSKPRRPCAKKRGKAKQRCARKHKRHSQKARANHNAGRTK